MNNEKIPHPLDKDLLQDFIILEERILTSEYSIDDVQKLVEIYSKLVEYYDSKKDPIKIFFMEKIQIVMSSKKTVEILSQPKKETKIRENKKSIYTNKEIRHIKSNYNYKKENLKKDNDKEEADKIVDKLEKKHEELNKVINNEFNKQNLDLKEKLKQRKERSINKSLNKSNNKLKDEKIEKDVKKNILNDLKENEIENPFN